MTTPRMARPQPPNTLVIIGAVVVVAGFLLPQFFSSSSAPPPRGYKPTDAPDYVGFLVKMLLGVAVLGVGGWLLSRRNKPQPTLAKQSQMEVLASVAVASHGYVHLVRAGQRRLLLGVDAGGVKVVTELPGRMPSNIVGPLRLSTGGIG